MALFMIDVFSRFAVAMTLASKQPNDILNALKRGIEQMGKKPETIYSDNEGGLNSKQIQEWAKENNIRLILVNTKAAFVERLIRTIKDGVYKRADRLGRPWHEYLQVTMKSYNNNKEHSNQTCY
jgi:transposase InsO family protein